MRLDAQVREKQHTASQYASAAARMITVVPAKWAKKCSWVAQKTQQMLWGSHRQMAFSQKIVMGAAGATRMLPGEH